MYLLLGKNVSMYILEDDIAACVFEGWFWDEKSPRFYSVPVSFDPFIENIDGEFTLTEAQRANDETSKTLNKISQKSLYYRNTEMLLCRKSENSAEVDGQKQMDGEVRRREASSNRRICEALNAFDTLKGALSLCLL